jgi:hypothetical protein
MWILDVIANLAGGKSTSMTDQDNWNLLPPTDDVYNYNEVEDDEPFDPFCGHTTIVFYENGTSGLHNHNLLDAHDAANLLGAHDHHSYYSTVEMKYYGLAHPNLKIYLKRNRVTLQPNRALQFHFNIKEKGPVVVYNMDAVKRPWTKFIPLNDNHPVGCHALLHKPVPTKPITIPNQESDSSTGASA